MDDGSIFSLKSIDADSKKIKDKINASLAATYTSMYISGWQPQSLHLFLYLHGI